MVVIINTTRLTEAEKNGLTGVSKLPKIIKSSSRKFIKI